MSETTGAQRNLGHVLEFNHLISGMGLMEVLLQGRAYTNFL
jgi:hypothetical protein